MKATDLLRKQHAEVTELFERCLEEPMPELCARLFAMIRAHSVMEEELVYPRFAEKEGLEAVVGESYTEHDEVKLALADCERADLDDPSFVELLENLQALVLEHVELEESELLPAIESRWTNDMLTELATDCRLRFEELVAGDLGEEAAT